MESAPRPQQAEEEATTESRLHQVEAEPKPTDPELVEGGDSSGRIPHGMQQQLEEMDEVLGVDREEREQEQGCWAKCCTTQTIVRVVVGLAYLAVVLVLVLVVKIQDRIADVEDMAEQYRALAGFLLFTIHAVTVVCYLPGTILCIVTTGVIFDFWAAFATIYTSAVVAHTIAFLLGRYMFRGLVSRWASKYKLWRAIDTAIASEGFKVTLMLRAPGMPTSLFNWLLGITPIEFWKYSLASAIGVIPRIGFYVYFGELFGDLIQAITGQIELSTGDFVRLGVSLGLAILCLILLIVFLRRALKRTLKRVNAEEADSANAAGEEAGEMSSREPHETHRGSDAV